jgi:hypothetical protein
MGVMKASATKPEWFNRAPVWRLIAALVLLAFSFQTYVAQTHIHQSPIAGLASIAHPSHKTPTENSPFDCPFCQAVAHGTSFLQPDSLTLLPSAQSLQIPVPHTLSVAKNTAADHSWRSRAPPSL